MTKPIDFVRYLDLRKQVERRRRIYAIADWWALYLTKKYGGAGKARARCVQHQVSTAKRDSALRNHIWCQVNRRLKSDLDFQ